MNYWPILIIIQSEKNEVEEFETCIFSNTKEI